MSLTTEHPQTEIPPEAGSPVEWPMAESLVTRRGSLRSQWRTEVLASHRITDSVRVLLLLLHEHMNAQGQVSVPRRKLAEYLNKSERRIDERLQRAREAGFLTRKVSGQPGRTAVYLATIPARAENDRRSRKRDLLAEMRALPSKGTQADIAEALHVDQGTVSRTLTRHGYELRNGAIVPKPEAVAA